jgi:exosortase
MLVRGAVGSVLWTLSLLFFWSALAAAAHLALFDDRYMPISVAPVISLILFCRYRKQIFRDVAWDLTAGLPLVAITLAISSLVVFRQSPDPNSIHLSLEMLCLVLMSVAVFVICFGRECFKTALFPFCCLLLVVPAPAWIMDRFVTFLQHGSAVMSYRMMHLAGVPVVAHDQRLILPNLELEVAPECSGIRSCLALVLVTLLAGRLALTSGWSRVTLVLASIPLAVLKNAVRITVIAVLGAYVNHAFVQGPIHRYGGLIFTPFEVIALAWLLKGLRALDGPAGDNSAVTGRRATAFGPSGNANLTEGLTAPRS